MRKAAFRTSTGRAALGGTSRPIRSVRSPPRSFSRRRVRPSPGPRPGARAGAWAAGGGGGGDFAGLVGWLRSRIHAKASLLDTDALMTEATGRPLGTDAYLDHLSRRYIGEGSH